MNPDADINVMVVYPDGFTATYGHANKFTGDRSKLYSHQYPTYGAARLAAVEYEEHQRAERAQRGK